MNVKWLIDSIVQQTTVLIATLSTTAGVRAPLAHIADQVFLDLSRAIEAQGVGKKVVADMFGVALRTYQRKVQRMTESSTVRELTLWEALLDYLQVHGSRRRDEIMKRFHYDGESNVAAVLNDLVGSGLVYRTGQGDTTIYGITSESDLEAIMAQDELDGIMSMLWVNIYRLGPLEAERLAAQMVIEDHVLHEALSNLEAEGRVMRDDEGRWRAARLMVPVGAEYGWEAAVFDHFQAMVTALSSKLSQKRLYSQRDDVVGGATLSFDIHPGHPFEEQVYDQLKTVRALVNALWDQVSSYNAETPVPDEDKTKVTFYFGQVVQDYGEPRDTSGVDASTAQEEE